MSSRLYETGDALCYVCEKRDNPVIYIDGANYPYDWACVPCLVERLNDGAVPKVECEDCSDVARRHYCHYHYDANIQGAQEDAIQNHEPRCYSCDYETDYLYCEDCNPSNNQPECDQCARIASMHYCDEHYTEVPCSEYACRNVVSTYDIKCDEHSERKQPVTNSSAVAAVVSDDGSTITTDGITVKWEV